MTTIFGIITGIHQLSVTLRISCSTYISYTLSRVIQCQIVDTSSGKKIERRIKLILAHSSLTAMRANIDLCHSFRQTIYADTLECHTIKELPLTTLVVIHACIIPIGVPFIVRVK